MSLETVFPLATPTTTSTTVPNYKTSPAEDIFFWGFSPLSNLSLSLPSENGNNSTAAAVCTFEGITSPQDLLNLFFRDRLCYRHSLEFTIFLCVANLLILIVGLVGNSLVIYVVTWKIGKGTASSLFIRNLAVADLLVVLFCIPATLFANIFTPWILGKVMCKAVTYAQGVSVFSSVFSLVAISFDRCRAMHQSLAISPNLSITQAKRIILLIWIFALSIPLPWAVVFQLVTVPVHVHVHSDCDYQMVSESGASVGSRTSSPSPHLIPFCHEAWRTKTQEIVYFLGVNVFLCYLLPLTLIVLCNVVIWQNVLASHQVSSLSQSNTRRLRVLKVFTGLTFTFFLCWLPLYVIMIRVKFFYDDEFSGSAWEQSAMTILIPTAQLLGSCNSCVNPVLYSVLNQTFRETLRSILTCSSTSPCCRLVPMTSFTPLVTTRGEYNSVGATIPFRVTNKKETHV